MIREAIILAGGLGTRLRSVIKDIPKPMAEVAGVPFLKYTLNYLRANKISRVILAVGYKHEIIRNFLENPHNNYGLEICYSIEEDLLGTGGAVYKGFEQIAGESAFIINGDTYFDPDLSDLEKFAQSSSASVAMALKKIQNSQRYGSVSITENGKIIGFKEKGLSPEGNTIINGGIYYMKKALIDQFNMPKKFSLEKDLFEDKVNDLAMFGKIYHNTFIDIGIPSDYAAAQTILKNII
ncbi:nucleotidyltransferase family protein [Pararcticibacter amylolyticus]|uniref:D-mannose-1-phosphate guanyltransferase n=1 Tax=Pararcticibacter amylolyticus TaxID=2173175 RepID=A0A2U2PBM0_9SPHI|nr:nucleotidyltransferase family protein [Pararcticibacter amylolyticus]PWG78798.1 D-mannose-1-phosphate guanyltransferase [Pararcticibacter amylolyticus]